MKIKTIYSGWYYGPTAHIHFKVHLGANQILTSQFYFDDVMSDQVFQKALYSSRTGTRLLNNQDMIVSSDTPRVLKMPVNLGSEGASGIIRIGVASS